MKLILRLIITAVLVIAISYFLKGIVVDSFTSALKVAVVLALLNFLVKPVLVLLTLPVTIFTFGLFLLVINAMIILLCDNLVDDSFRSDCSVQFKSEASRGTTA